MPLMTWTDKMSVRVGSIDEEHKKLVAIINQLYDGIQARQGHEVLGDVLAGLVAYASEHFQHEEHLFAQTGYPDAAQHIREHNDFAAHVREMQHCYSSAPTAVLSVEVLDFLRKWLIDHVQGSDRKYSEYFVAAGVS